MIRDMRLAPRQLMRSGMTGNVPYYGGRFTPGQAYALTHPARPPAPAPPAPPPPPQESSAMQALRHLFETGVLTQAEYDEFRARVDS
jgi:hypothetical protein